MPTSKKKQALSALEKLKQTRELGLKRSDYYEGESDDDDDDGYQYVNEDEYRKNQGEFVVDDDGSGYKEADEKGLDDEVNEAALDKLKGTGDIGALKRQLLAGGESDKLSNMKGSKKRKHLLDQKEIKGKNQRLSVMFKNAAKNPHNTIGPGLKSRERETQVEASLQNESLDGLLNKMVTDASTGRNRKKKSKKKSTKKRAAKKREYERGDDVDLFDKEEEKKEKEDDGPIYDDDCHMPDEDDTSPPATSQDSKDQEQNDKDDEEEMDELEKPKPKKNFLELARTKAIRKAPKVEVSTPPAVSQKVTFMVTPPTGTSATTEVVGWKSEESRNSGEIDSILKDNKKFIDFFWMDLYEDYRNISGKLYMFGKIWCEATKRYESCSVEIPNVPRVLYVLPREKYVDEDTGEETEVTMKDVYDEFGQMLLRKVIRRDETGQTGYKAKSVKLKYAFELAGVPREETEYMMFQYPMGAELVRLPFDTSGKTFSHVFGTHQSAIEQLLLSRNMMGPCWLRLSNVVTFEDTAVSHCKFHIGIESPRSIDLLEVAIKKEGVTGEIVLPDPPKLRVLSLTLKTVVSPETKHHEIVMVSGLLRDGVDLVGATPESGSRDKISDGFTLVRGMEKKPIPQGFNKVKRSHVQNMGNLERSLLSCLLGKIKQLDPDVIMGHNIRQFDIDVLLNRMKEKKVNNWSVLGRLNIKRHPEKRRDGGGYYSSSLTPGRLLLDTYITSKELLLGQRSYSLTEMCRTQLGRDRVEVQPVNVPSYYDQEEEGQKLVQLCAVNEQDAWLTLQLSFKLEAMPLTMQLSNLGGNVWSRTLAGGRAERIEFLLLHEFDRCGYVLPDKISKFEKERMSTNSKSKRNTKKRGGATAASSSSNQDGEAAKKKTQPRRGKPKYGGGLVLEPKRGLYDKFILLLDFNSLYPSIIQEYNICYTTVQRRAHDLQSGPGGGSVVSPVLDGDDNVPELEEDDIPDLPDASGEQAVLPRLISGLVNRRKAVKKRLKIETDQAKLDQLEVRQKALKLTANSMYGCLGFNGFRFFAKPVAALVTSQGRKILRDTVDLAQECGYEVIYGDTDSIMINTNTTDFERVKKISREVQEKVNEKYKLLEIAMDGAYQTMLLLRKKKYAALMVKSERRVGDRIELVTEKETKGLDLVRRDWCKLSKDVGHAVLDLILSGSQYDEIVSGVYNHLEMIAEKISNGQIPLEDFVIIKGLSKRPQDYPDAKGMAHIRVALAMISQNKHVGVGDHIPYVICTLPRNEYTKQRKAIEDGKPIPPVTGRPSSSTYADRAYHPDEVKYAMNHLSGILQIDIEWYLKQQLVPPTFRLCEPIQDISQSEIATKLGLDPSQISAGPTSYDNDDDPMLNIVNPPDSERYKNCERVVVSCSECLLDFPYLGPVVIPSELAKEVDSASTKERLSKKPRETLWGVKCPGCDHQLDTAYLENMLTLASRKAIGKYYDGYLVADDPSIDIRTRQHSILGKSYTLRGRRMQLQPEYGPGTAYTQLKYIESLTNTPRAEEQLEKLNSKRKEPYRLVQGVPQNSLAELAQVNKRIKMAFVDQNAYNWVEPSLFKFAFKV